jgi:predicted molibdopterin-dependent oxidoreductase YjgC
LQFQKPNAEVQLSREDAQARSIRNGQTVTVSSNGTSVELRARIAKDLQGGVVRIARDHAGDLHANVEVTP